MYMYNTVYMYTHVHASSYPYMHVVSQADILGGGESSSLSPKNVWLREKNYTCTCIYQYVIYLIIWCIHSRPEIDKHISQEEEINQNVYGEPLWV